MSLVVAGWEKVVGRWLLGASGCIGGMCLLGAYTRLSGSGLSMTSWSALGSLPPRTEEAWKSEFDRYKTFPEYKALHAGNMTMEEFKRIYYVEYIHRMSGRALGFYFALPLMYFLRKGVLTRRMQGHLGGLLVAGSAQGAVGWWMVKSGLEPENLVKPEYPRVSPYRLASHWILALLLFAGTATPGLRLVLHNRLARLPALTTEEIAAVKRTRSALKPAFMSLTATLLSAPFVAGNDAGRAYNTWPKMNYSWIPEEVRIAWKSPLANVKAYFEDSAVVQFNHRMLAYLTFGTSWYFGFAAHAITGSTQGVVSRAAVWGLPAIVSSQVLLGILTLLMYVPAELGVLHQGIGLSTLAYMLYLRALFKAALLKGTALRVA